MVSESAQVTNVSIRYQPNGGNPLIIPVFAELSSENVQLVATRDQKKDSARAPALYSVPSSMMDCERNSQYRVWLPDRRPYRSTCFRAAPPNCTMAILAGWRSRPCLRPCKRFRRRWSRSTTSSLLPLDELVEDTRTLIKGANRLVNDPAIPQAVVNASQAMADLQQVARTLDSRIEPLISSLETASGTANRTLQSAQEIITSTGARSQQTFREIDAMLQAARQALTQADPTLKTTNNVIQPGAQFNYELINALNETATAARSLRELADQLQRSPNSLLFGRPNAGTGR